MRLKVSGILAACLLGAACGDDDEGLTFPPLPDLAFSVSPTAITVKQDACVVVDANLTSAGTEVLSQRIAFSVGDPGIATFTESDDTDPDTPDDVTKGRVCGVDGGVTDLTITASSSGQDFSETVSVTVVDDPVASIVIRPEAATVFVGAVLSLETDVVTAEGDTVNRETNVTGRSDIGIRRVSYESSDESIATVSSRGRVTGVQPGTALIIASIEGKADTATVTVALRPVETVEIEPALSAIFVGDTVHLTVTVTAANGETLTGRDIDFSSSDTAIATVDEDGIVTGIAVGDVTITATSEGKSGVATVSVAAEP